MDSAIPPSKDGVNPTVFPKPIRILSDVHLGHPACIVRDPNSLAPLFEGAATVIFNGDSAELRFRSNRHIGLGHIEALKKVCISAGATPVFVNGNHDPQISDYNHLDLLDGHVLVTHGDLLYKEIAPWSADSKLLLAAHEEALAGAGPDLLADFEVRLDATKRASLAYELKEPHIPQGAFARIVAHLETIWPPTSFFTILRVWCESPGCADTMAYAFRPRARFVLIGHTHWAGVWHRPHRVIINTGGFTSILGRRLVEIVDNSLTVFRVKKKGAGFRKSDTGVNLPLE